jgi:fluoroquinolone transport system ATP-binding protein
MGVIDVRNLRFTYAKARVPALDGLDFDIRRGEIFGFLGPNGAGKSTTQRILIGLLKGYQGSASAFGRAVADWGADYYERIGVCFEMPNHYLKLTGLENLAYFRSLYRVDTQTPEALLDSVGLAADRRMPVSQYSRGMKTRLSVARSLLNNPELIFLDEPTTGLDPVGAQRIRTLIRTQKANGRTVFLTTHDMTVADDLCDRVASSSTGRSG